MDLLRSHSRPTIWHSECSISPVIISHLLIGRPRLRQCYGREKRKPLQGSGPRSCHKSPFEHLSECSWQRSETTEPRPIRDTRWIADVRKELLRRILLGTASTFMGKRAHA